MPSQLVACLALGAVGCSYVEGAGTQTLKGIRWAFADYPAAHCEYATITNCAHYPDPPALARVDPTKGYRFENLPQTATNSDTLFVALVFSGGGTRAAALSYGVLRELGRTMIPGRTRTLLDEVDVVSSVSGGSFAAAYFGLYGPAGLPKFDEEFLKWQATRSLILHALNQHEMNKLASDYYSRIDVATELWDDHLFHGKTFASLMHRPFLLINATDVSQGTVLPFIQSQLDAMCIDLAGFSIARAVAASGAFPPLLNPVTLVNHADACRYAPPEWVHEALASGGLNPSRYRSALELMSYTNAATRPFIHLTDGGVGDNIGSRNLVRALTTDQPFPLRSRINGGSVKRVLIVVVNAKPTDENLIDKRGYAPGLVETALRAAGAPMDNYSRESILDLWDAVHEWERAAPRQVCAIPSQSPCGSMFYTVELSFDDVQDPDERRFYQRLPTSYQLPGRTVDLLTALGGQLLRNNAEFNRLLCDLAPDNMAVANNRATAQRCMAAAAEGNLYFNP